MPDFYAKEYVSCPIKCVLKEIVGFNTFFVTAVFQWDLTVIVLHEIVSDCKGNKIPFKNK
jgi:hypothetical protein